MMSENQTLKNPYCFAEVRSFGENGPERDEFGRRHGSLDQQLWSVNRAHTRVFVGAARQRESFHDSSWRTYWNSKFKYARPERRASKARRFSAVDPALKLTPFAAS